MPQAALRGHPESRLLKRLAHRRRPEHVAAIGSLDRQLAQLAEPHRAG